MNFPLIIPDNSTGLAEDILDNVLILIENSLSVYSEANNFMKLYLEIQNSKVTKLYTLLSLKNGASLILPSRIARNSWAPNANPVRDS